MDKIWTDDSWEQYEDGCIKIYQCKNHYDDK